MVPSAVISASARKTARGPGSSQEGHGPNLDAASQPTSRRATEVTFRAFVVISQLLTKHPLDLGGQVLFHPRGKQRHIAILHAPRPWQVDLYHARHPAGARGHQRDTGPKNHRFT